MIARLKNSEIIEKKESTKTIIRDEQALNGFGWYNVIKDNTELQACERVLNTEYIFIENEVREVKTIENIDIDDYKITKKNEIKNVYNELINEGFLCSNSIRLDCRESDKINWLALKLQCATATEEININLKDFNNILHENMLIADVLLMMTELEEYYATLLKTKWDYQELIESYINYEDINIFYWRKVIIDSETQEESFIYWGE